jgi:polyisoprenoid-binding protein YceI
MKTRIFPLLMTAAGFFPQGQNASAAQQYEVVEAGSSVGFLAVGKPGFLKIKGEGGSVKGNAEVDGTAFKGTFNAMLPAIKTGIDLRDEHMHGKYLETGKFPEAVLTLSEVKFENGSAGKCSFKGQLTVKGVTKDAAGECNIEGLAGDTVTVKASTEINIEDYPIGVPSHLGIKVADKITISTEFQAKKKS